MEKKREMVERLPEHTLRDVMSMNERRRLKAHLKENTGLENTPDLCYILESYN